MSTQKTNLLKDVIRERRLELGLNQRDIAREIGFSALDYIGMVEAGARRLQLEHLDALARVLKLPTEDLVEMHFREVYGKPETQWLLDMLFSPAARMARDLSKLDDDVIVSIKTIIETVLKRSAQEQQQQQQSQQQAQVTPFRRAS